MTSEGATTCVKADVLSAYKFHMFSQARELEARGSLGSLYTAMPRRVVSEISAERVRSRWGLAVARQGLRKIGQDRFRVVTRAVIRDFDSWILRQGASASEVVIGHSSFATKSLLAASHRGQRTVCDRGSWHILEQKQVLEDEYERWGLKRSDAPFDPWIIDRELQEYAAVDRIVVPSSGSASSFKRRGHHVDQLTINHYGADLRRFFPAQEQPRDMKRIICVANPSLQKGHPYLLQAYALVRGSGTSLELLGQRGPSMEGLSHLFSGDDIEEPGRFDALGVASRLRSAGIFALASVHEGFGMVVLEAMASGLPVVVSDATGASDLVEDGVTGFVVPARDPEAMAARFDALLSDPELARGMGAAGASKVAAMGGWAAYGARASEMVAVLARTGFSAG